MNGGKVAAVWQHYLDSAPASPCAAPARAADPSGPPPAYVATAEFDPNGDEASTTRCACCGRACRSSSTSGQALSTIRR